MNQEKQTLNISPWAILAAVLFHARSTVPVMVKPDDASPEVEIQASLIGIEQTEDALVCMLPLELVTHFASQMYDAQFIVNGNTAILSFEKHIYTGADLYSANGTKVPKKSDVIQGLIEKLNGESNQV